MKPRMNRSLRFESAARASTLLIILYAGAAFAQTAQMAQPDWAAEGQAWWAHIQYLASDDLQGRDTGSVGYQKAADYVAKQFADAGLQPAGTSGFMQTMDLEVRQIDESRSSIELMRNGMGEPLKLGDDVTLHVYGDPAATLKAPAVFVGYGFAVPEAKYDEFAGQDLRGKIAVYITGGPTTIPSALRSHYQSLGERWAALQRAGAVGIAVIGNPKNASVPWERSSLARLNPSMGLMDTKLAAAHGMKFSASINAAQADKWLAGTGHTITELLASADSGEPLPKFPLDVTVRARIAYTQHKVSSMNVLGVLPGSDPKLKSEYVAISAHLDHVGIGQPINGDNIYNGAMDNASGVASLIEVAKHLKRDGVHPRRSILFAAVTGEEKGELGSEYFAAHPTMPRNQIVADLNMDMFLPLFALKYLEIQGLDESTLGDDVRTVAEPRGVIIQADKEPDQNRFTRSDQYSFVKAGIPALAFKFGWVPGTPEEKTFKEWVRVRYHAPSDDLNQPVDAPAAAQFNALLQALAVRVADADGRPSWKPTSFFRRFAQQ
jgi:Zn-dependent M28 family amino/carboxypeptidase